VTDNGSHFSATVLAPQSVMKALNVLCPCSTNRPTSQATVKL